MHNATQTQRSGTGEETTESGHRVIVAHWTSGATRRWMYTILGPDGSYVYRETNIATSEQAWRYGYRRAEVESR